MSAMRQVPLLLWAVVAVSATLAVLHTTVVGTTTADDPAPLRWEATQARLPAGPSVRLEAHLAGADGVPVSGTPVVESARLDMGPDGMAAMTAELRPVPASGPGAVAYEADLVMAGRWALTLSARLDGHPQPAQGVVVFTAEPVAEAMPIAAAGRERRVVYYRNPMGLADTSPVPKKDWMGMDYIPVYEDEVNDPHGTVRISVEKVQRAGVRTATVVRRELLRTVRAFGTVEADESRLAAVTARFDGFVEELLVPLTGAEVRAGSPLLRVWIESAEILQKQADYLLALKNPAARPGDLERTEQNLRQFGLSADVIATLRRTGTPVRSLVLTAPRDGTVMRKPALVGMRFTAGDTLYGTADLSVVWVMARVAERDLALVHAGQSAQVTVNAYADMPLQGSVDFVYPDLDPATRTALIRVVLPNPDGRLRTGLYADVDIETPVQGEAVVALPESAIIDSGMRQVAFVSRGEGVFEPRTLVLGRRGNGYVEVREGIEEGERVVVTGNFLIDAESNLRAALAGFMPPEAMGGDGESVTGTEARP